MAENALTLSPEEVLALDASYREFPAFKEWPRELADRASWDAHLQELETLRRRAQPAQLDQALAVALRAAAIETGAIEGLYSTDRGFTFTVMTQAAAWEAAVAERGEHVRFLFDAQLHTYELVLDAATHQYPLTEAWIRRLHEEICAPQETYGVITAVGMQEQPLPKGEYKRSPNHVRLADGSEHAYAPVDKTADEMNRLVAELNTDQFDSADPVLQAAFSHYALVAIHPFADGNGRVARALASTYLYRSARIPLVVLSARRSQYFSALEAADRGNLEAFAGFVLDAAQTATLLVIDSLLTAFSPQPEVYAQRLHALLTAQGGLTHSDLDRLGQIVAERLAVHLQEAIQALPLPPGVNVAVTPSNGGPHPEEEGFRAILEGGSRSIRVRLMVSPPAAVDVGTEAFLLVSKARDARETVLLTWPDGRERIVFGLHDLHPSPSTLAEQRLAGFARRLLGRQLQHVTDEVDRVLRQAGYIS
jgi:Fic family protein